MRWLRRADGHLLALLAITVAINVPFFSPRFLTIQDSLSNLVAFQFTYSEFFLQGTFPRWNPYEAYGIPFDFALFATLRPTDYVVMLAGYVLGAHDAAVLSQVSFVLSDCLFVLGLYLLSRNLCESSLSVWLVCLGGLLTNAWTYSIPWNFAIFYLLPLVFYFLLKFRDSGRPLHLWLAALVELVSLLGSVSYLAPVHLMILLVFLAPFLWRDPGWILRLVRWRNFAHPLFVPVLLFGILLPYLVFGGEAAFVRSGRDTDTGNASPEIFLNYARLPMRALVDALLFGDVYQAEVTLYVGFLILPMTAYALLRRRNTPVVAFALVALVLWWFAVGGWFSILAYHVVPLMKKFRLISYQLNIAKLPLLILGGVGFDQLVRDLKQAVPGPQTRSGSASPERRWLFPFLLVAALLADFLSSFRPLDLTESHVFGMELGHSVGTLWLCVRFCLYACAFALLLGHWALPDMFRAWAGARTECLALLFFFYIIDVGMYYVQVVKTAPFYDSDVTIGDEFQVRALHYSPRRGVPLSALLRPPVDVPTVRKRLLESTPTPLWANVVTRLLTRRGHPFDQLVSTEIYLCMNYETIQPDFPVSQVMPGVEQMLLARGGSLGARASQGPAFIILKDRPLVESLGFAVDDNTVVNKIRMVRKAVFASNEQQAFEVFGNVDPRDTLVLIGTPKPTETQPTGVENGAGRDGEPQVVQFSANRLVLRITAGAPGWLFCADAYHPGWKATVDGKPTEVFRANLGCRAVHLSEGTHTVEFFFDDGLRNTFRRVFLLCAGVAGWALMIGLIAAPWAAGSCRRVWTGECLAISDRKKKAWATLALLLALICAFLVF